MRLKHLVLYLYRTNMSSPETQTSNDKMIVLWRAVRSEVLTALRVLLREDDYPNDAITQTDFGIALGQCDMHEDDMLFLRASGVTTIPEYAYCVMTEDELRREIIVPAGD